MGRGRDCRGAHSKDEESPKELDQVKRGFVMYLLDTETVIYILKGHSVVVLCQAVNIDRNQTLPYSTKHGNQ